MEADLLSRLRLNSHCSSTLPAIIFRQTSAAVWIPEPLWILIGSSHQLIFKKELSRLEPLEELLVVLKRTLKTENQQVHSLVYFPSYQNLLPSKLQKESFQVTHEHCLLKHMMKLQSLYLTKSWKTWQIRVTDNMKKVAGIVYLSKERPSW